MNQRKQILAHLLKHGQISDQSAKQMGIDRLPVYINRLREHGWPIVYVDIGKVSAYIIKEDIYDLLQRKL